MILVGARCHLVGERALAESELRSECRALYAKLLHHFKRRIEVGGITFGFRLRSWNSVVEDLLLEVDAPVHAMRECIAGYAWSKKLQAIDLSTATSDFYRE